MAYDPKNPPVQINADTPEGIMRQAAEAAKVLLPRLIAERDQLQKRVGEIQSQILNLNSIVAVSTSGLPNTSYGGVHVYGVIPTSSTAMTTSTSTVVSSGSGPAVIFNKEQKLTTEEKIAVVLSQHDRPLSSTELMSKVPRHFNQDIPQSTLYAAIASGKRSGRFKEEKDGKVRLLKAGDL